MRAIKNLNETIGKSLVIEVIKIQTKLIRIAMVTGCFRSLASIVLLCNCLKIKINIIPKMIGSVGKLKPNPPSIFWRLIARGVRKTTTNINLSNENNANSKTRIAAGIRLK